MDNLSRSDFSELIGQHQEPCVSIFLPTYHAGNEVQQNPIRFKNVLRKAQSQLEAAGLSPMDAQSMLRPATGLLDDVLFWQHQDAGLAVFISRDFSNGYRLPCQFRELVLVNKKFYIKPLFPMLSIDGRFYVLAVSQKQVRFLECSRYSVRELDLPDAPKSIEDVLQYFDMEKQTQYRTASSAAMGRGVAMFHGHGGAGGDESRHKEDISRFFKEIDNGIPGEFKSSPIPVVFAGVDYLFPIFREANTCKGLLERPITGCPEELSNEELHRQAWPIVESHFEEKRNRASDLYHQFLRNNRSSKNIREIVPAAREGRIDSLFIASDKAVLGKFNADLNEVSLSQKHAAELEDLLDLAAVETFLHDGIVYPMQEEEMPDKAVIAAVFRY